MGRAKIQMKKIEDRQQRNIAFAKRKHGILKKAYELYTLCDVQVAVILFSPSGKLFIFDTKASIEETILKYVNLPSYKRGSLPDEQFVRRLVDDMRMQSLLNDSNSRGNFDDGIRYQTQSKKIQDEIDECNAQLANVEQQLGYYLKNPSHWESTAEIDYQEELLQKTLAQVRSRKEELEFEAKPVDVSSWNFPANEIASKL